MNKKTNTVPYTNDRREGRTHPDRIEWNPDSVHIDGMHFNFMSRDKALREAPPRQERIYNRAQRRANGQTRSIPIKKSAARRQLSR